MAWPDVGFGAGVWTGAHVSPHVKTAIAALCRAVNERKEALALEETDIISVTRSGSIVTVTMVAHGFVDDDYVLVAGAVQTEYNGVYKVNEINANQFQYTISGTPATPATGDIIIKKPDYELFAYNNAGDEKPYPTESDLIGLWVSRTVLNDRQVTSITRSGSTATVTLNNHGIPQYALVEISGANQPEYNGVQFVTAVTTNTFAYSVGSGEPVSPATGTITVKANGLWASSVTRSGSTVTVNVAKHGYAVGDWVSIRGATQTEYNGMFQIVTAGTNSYTYSIVGTPASPATGQISCHAITGARLILKKLQLAISSMCDMSTSVGSTWFADPLDYESAIVLTDVLNAGSFGSAWLAIDKINEPDLYHQMQEALEELVYVSTEQTPYDIDSDFKNGDDTETLEAAWDEAVASSAISSGSDWISRYGGINLFGGDYGVSLYTRTTIKFKPLQYTLEEGEFRFEETHLNISQDAFDVDISDSTTFTLDIALGNTDDPVAISKGQTFFDTYAKELTIEQSSLPSSHPFDGESTLSSIRRIRNFSIFQCCNISGAMTYA